MPKTDLDWPTIAVLTPGDCGLQHLVARSKLLYGQGMRMLVLREPTLQHQVQLAFAEQMAQHCPELKLVHHFKCPGTRSLLGQAGVAVHLPGAVEPRSLPGLGAFGVSVHSERELEVAAQAGASYAMLAPVWSPNSKPGDRRPTFGAQGYEAVLAKSAIPLYALGGVNAQRCAPWRGRKDLRVALIGELFGHCEERALLAFAELCQVFGQTT